MAGPFAKKEEFSRVAEDRRRGVDYWSIKVGVLSKHSGSISTSAEFIWEAL